MEEERLMKDADKNELTNGGVTLLHSHAMGGTMQVEVAQTPTTQNIVVEANTINLTSLGAKNITVSIPTGAVIINVIALARIAIMNNSTTIQKIDLRFIVNTVTLFNQLDIVGFPAGSEGASTTFIMAEDATDEVTINGQVVTLEAMATLSSAFSVRFQAGYFLFINYRL